MGKSAENLAAAVKIYMGNSLTDYLRVEGNKVPYCDGYMIFGGDGVWIKKGSNYEYLFMEQKSLHEASDYSGSWWNWNSQKANNGNGHYNLSGYRSLISHILGIDPRDEKSQIMRNDYKWLQIIAQLRHDILNLDHSRIAYRSVFAVPTEELNSFKSTFVFFSSSRTLNPFLYSKGIALKVWTNTFDYEDDKYGNVNVTVVEIDYDNFFSPRF